MIAHLRQTFFSYNLVEKRDEFHPQKDLVGSVAPSRLELNTSTLIYGLLFFNNRIYISIRDQTRYRTNYTFKAIKPNVQSETGQSLEMRRLIVSSVFDSVSALDYISRFCTVCNRSCLRLIAHIFFIFIYTPFAYITNGFV